MPYPMDDDDASTDNQELPPGIDCPPGEQIQLLLGENGSDYVLVLDRCSMDGSTIDQTVEVGPSAVCSPSLLRRIEKCQGKSWIKSIAYGLNEGGGAQWFLQTTKKEEGAGDQAWWDVPAKTSEVIDAKFNENEDNEFLQVVLGPDGACLVVSPHGNDGMCGFVASNNVPHALKARLESILVRKGKIKHIRIFPNGGFFILHYPPDLFFLERTLHGVPRTLEDELAKCDPQGLADDQVLDIVVDKEGNWVVIREFSFIVSQGISEKLESKLTQFFLDEYTHRNNMISNKEAEVMRPSAEEWLERIQEKEEDDDEDEDEVGKSRFEIIQIRRQKAKRLQKIRTRGLIADSFATQRVTVVGYSAEPGDTVIKSIAKNGTLVVAKFEDPALRETVIDDPQKVCVFEAVKKSPTAEAMKLMKAMDKYEAAAVPVNTTQYSKSTSLQKNRSQLTTQVSTSSLLTVSTSGSTSCERSPSYTSHGERSHSFSSQEESSIKGEQSGYSYNNAVNDIIVEPVFEELDEVSPFDIYCCPEKIDMARLKRMVDDLATDRADRISCLDGLLRRRKAHPDQETKAESVAIKKLQRLSELDKVMEALHTMLDEFRMDGAPKVVHKVVYHHRDTAQRGRLFAQGQHVAVAEHGKRGGCPRNTTLQSMSEDWRAPLIGAFAHEVEWDQAGVSILCSLAKQLDLSHLIPTIIEFQLNPSSWTKKVRVKHNVPGKIAKKWPDIIVAGGLPIYRSWLKKTNSPDKKVKKLTFGIAMEASVLAAELLGHPRFQWTMLEREMLVKEGKPAGEITTILLGRIIQSCENEVLGILHRCFDNSGWKVRSKLFDGVIVEKEPQSKKGLVEAMSLAQSACASQGWQVKLVEKSVFGLQDEPVKTIGDARQAMHSLTQAAASRRRRSHLKMPAAN